MPVGPDDQRNDTLPARLTWRQSTMVLAFVAAAGAFTTLALHGNCSGAGIGSPPVDPPDPRSPLGHWCGHFDKLDGWVLTFAGVGLAALGIVALRRRFVPSLFVSLVAVVPSAIVAIALGEPDREPAVVCTNRLRHA